MNNYSKYERVMGFKPTTFCMASRRTITVLYPLMREVTILRFPLLWKKCPLSIDSDISLYSQDSRSENSACSLRQNQQLRPAHATETEAEPIRNCQENSMGNSRSQNDFAYAVCQQKTYLTSVKYVTCKFLLILT